MREKSENGSRIRDDRNFNGGMRVVNSNAEAGFGFFLAGGCGIDKTDGEMRETEVTSYGPGITWRTTILRIPLGIGINILTGAGWRRELRQK